MNFSQTDSKLWTHSLLQRLTEISSGFSSPKPRPRRLLPGVLPSALDGLPQSCGSWVSLSRPRGDAADQREAGQRSALSESLRQEQNQIPVTEVGQSIAYATGMNTNIMAALTTAFNATADAADNDGRIVTQVSHTVTVLSSKQSAARLAADALSFKLPRGYTGDIFLVTVCAATVAKF